MSKELRNPCIINNKEECLATQLDIDMGCEECPIFNQLPEEVKKELTEKYLDYPEEKRIIASFEVKADPSLETQKTITIEFLKSSDRMENGKRYPPYLVIGGDGAFIDYNEIPELFKIFKKLNKIYQKLKKQEGGQ